MNDVLQVADDIAVLYLGKMTAQVEAAEVSHSDVVKLITGGSMVEEGGHVAVTDAHDLDDDEPGTGGTGASA
jgi:ABC-type sugar transport system ATPase subunit